LLRRRSVLLLSLLGAACGSRTGLEARQLASDETGGGAVAAGGNSSRAGTGGSGAGAATAGSSSRGGHAGSGASVGGTIGEEGGFTGVAGEAVVVGGVGASDGGTPGQGGAPGEGGGPDAGGNGGEAGASPQPRATLVAAGAFHSCAGFDDGSLRCWGTAAYLGSGRSAATGDVGDDELPSRLGPVPIGEGARQISAGWYHTCALLESNRVRCFGEAAGGRLGYGNDQDIGDDERPDSVGFVSLGGRVQQVAAGPSHSCAVLRNGRVRCWGQNDQHQLGFASTATIGDDELPSSAGFVEVGGQVTQVATGFAHTCAVLVGGTVRCWGKNIAGGLGYPGPLFVGDDETPADLGDVEVGGVVTQVVTGMLHTCALLEGGRVRCWGASSYGQLGYGNTASIGDDETPASAGDVPVGGVVKQLAAGAFATCALLENGRVRCWGDGEMGELGYGNLNNIGDDELPSSAGDVDVGGVVTHLDAGFLHVCATLESGAVRCWGRGATAALGYGNLKNIGDDEAPSSAGDLSLF
jgi:alpha-tubulin suppressor-like RCC1 family protein